jgi:hypothetical protein
MIDRDKIVVIKSSSQIIVSYMGKRLILPVDEMKDKTKEEIRDWYINRLSFK